MRRSPTSASSALTWSLTVDCDAFSCSEAAQNVPASAIARREIQDGDTNSVAIMLGALITGLFALAIGLLATVGGVDSRPVDADRPTRWWPATPRD